MRPRKPRVLEDGCYSCGRSKVYCDSMTPARCCVPCSHYYHAPPADRRAS